MTRLLPFLCLLFFSLELPAYSGNESREALKAGLQRDVEFFSDSLCAGRKVGSSGSAAASFYITHRLKELGYEVQMNSFLCTGDAVGHNLVASTASSGKPAVLIMAYYDGLGKIGDRMYPGADSNGSGIAALLALAERFKGRKDLILAFVDGHNSNMAGADALKDFVGRQRLKAVISLDILGSTLAPPDKFWPNYLIILGGAQFQPGFDKLNAAKELHLYYNYYGSRSFTDLFYRKVSDHKVFFDKGAPVVMFTSGITLSTNREGDTADTLDYAVFAARVDLIGNWIQTQLP